MPRLNLDTSEEQPNSGKLKKKILDIIIINIKALSCRNQFLANETLKQCSEAILTNDEN